MIIFNLPLSFLASYGPGHVVIFNASDILHKVVEWTASPGQEGARVSPGRIGSVFFFPRASLDTLRGKLPGWGRTTNYGRAEHLMTQGELSFPSFFVEFDRSFIMS